MAEKQPQENNDRYRHAQQPKQDSSSHRNLLNRLKWQRLGEGGGSACRAGLRLPMSGIRHRRPRLRRRSRIAFLQEFDGVKIRGADKSKLSIANRPVDCDAKLHEAFAGRVDIVDLVGEMAEIAILAVFLFVPIIGELDEGRAASSGGFQQVFVFGRAKEYQREFAFVVIDAANLLQSQRVAIEF